MVNMNPYLNQLIPKKLTAALLLFVVSITIPGYLLADSPKQKPDQSWITVSGTAVETSDHGFTLDYGEGLIVVEVDDWDWFPEGQDIVRGHQVTVHGRIDDDMYEARSIEAGKVFIKDYKSMFVSPSYVSSYLEVISANPSDEELSAEVYAKSQFNPVTDGTKVTITGKIAGVDKRSFTISTGANKLEVDTRQLGYNPLDDKGYQRIDKGDTVTVVGTLDIDFFDDKKLVADDITKLMQKK